MRALRRATNRLRGRVSTARTVELRPAALGGLSMHIPWGYRAVYGGAYEQDVASALARMIKPGYSCADVGSHLGYFALLMAHLAGPDGRVVAFEASDDNARYIRRSAEANQARASIQVRHVAVTDGRSPHVQIYAGRGGGSMEWTLSREFAEREDVSPTAHNALEVPAVSLDDAFPPGARLDVAKMDIEGGEGPALEGATRMLREQRPVMVIEFHREVGWPAIETLLAADYVLEELDGTQLHAPADAQAVPYQFVARPA
jgi:FkbM family methyltransferase